MYDPAKHHRRSIRLKGYDYRRSGLYFITICKQNRAHLFGEIVGSNTNGRHENDCPENTIQSQLILNDAGRMIEKWYHELENKYPDKRCHVMIVMLNHFHCIIENLPIDHVFRDDHVGSTLRGRPENDERGRPENPYGIENKKYGATIADAMDWFKTMTNNEYIRGVKQLGWQRFDGKLWQRSYWEHIIRDEKSYVKISKYIMNNPANWINDSLQ
jgi:REP element-mobilizing transposase RayT